MIFMSYWFAAFAASFFTLYWSFPIFWVRRILILAFGIAFQLNFAGPAGVLPIIALGVLTYFAGISKQRAVQMTAIAVSILALIFYKYTIFLATELIGLFSPELANQSLAALKASILPAAPPLAISFFVFEFVHYLTDVLRGQKPIRSAADFGLFSLFWPTIVAGPIKRYEQFIPSMREGCTRVSKEDVMIGLMRVATGLVKKFIADNLTLMLDFWVAQYDTTTPGIRWMVFFGIGLRILLDFSGYSDIAIGFAKMMGIKVPENFNWPYLASGPIDFWRRWHISLSNWIRDYVYIPLGGSRLGMPRKIANGLFAFALCGLWHGAGWNFLVWGVYHGAGIALNNLWRDKIVVNYTVPDTWQLTVKVISWAGTLFFVLVGWLFFFFPVSKALHMLALLLGVK